MTKRPANQQGPEHFPAQTARPTPTLTIQRRMVNGHWRRRIKLTHFVVVVFVALLLCSSVPQVRAQQQQDPMTMYGGSVLAMAGRDCVVLAVDKRFGVGSSLIHIAPRPILSLPDRVMVAFTGLQGDVLSLKGELATQVAAKYNRGLGFGTSTVLAAHSSSLSPSVTCVQRTISARAVASLTSHVLYQKRMSGPYYVEPLVVGLEPDGWIVEEANGDDNFDTPAGDQSDSSVLKPQLPKQSRLRYRPYLCSMDTIGAKSESKSFICAGAASESLFGTAEALWKPDLEADELLVVCSKAFLSALERDCMSGYGAMLYLLTPNDGVVVYDVTGRSD